MPGSRTSLVRAKPYINPMVGMYLGLKQLEADQSLTLADLMSIEDTIRQALEIGPEEHKFVSESLRRLAAVPPVPSRSIP